MSGDNIIRREYESDYEVSYEKVKEYVRVLDDDNPYYTDREFVKSLDGGHPYAPPTFAAIYCQPALEHLYYDPEFSKLVSRLVHGEQEYHFHEPVRAGDRIHTNAVIDKNYTKTNQAGKVHRIFEIKTTSINQDNKLVCTGFYTLLIRGE